MSSYPLALRIVSGEIAESHRRISQAADDASLAWEDVSSIAGEENVRILALIESVDGAVDRFVKSNTDYALRAGILMFQQAAKHTDPEFIPDLLEGMNVLVSRVRRQAEHGQLIPMDYMDPQVRKELFLVESYLRTTESKLRE
ncbi:hypothetical protein A2635_02220 [Candidatus Peribacteria bacterium RIFCSPHIGHO2_01_FULL_51_9]|nr:MAG: hypothetical protein A2635_02220 [Candidatus Peribacteria bacterium RIFCSPHIGHO2_01_FULL_51_9]